MHPYKSLPPDAFWKNAIADRHFRDIVGLSRPKTKVRQEELVATAGSCFAQHISRKLKSEGFNYLDVEPAPPRLREEHHAKFGYGLFSGRYGNIYTSAQLWQLVQRAFGNFVPEERIWRDENRFYDPFRPSIEPNGFGSEDEALRSQDSHLASIRVLLARADVFVFTFGLTEAWRSSADGAVYPTCPGTQAGQFDPARHEFVNLGYDEVLADMRSVIKTATRVKPSIRFLLTVSPVPLIATASGQHVLVATMHSKSILRAAAGQLQLEFENVDYFPSYEIVTSHVFGGAFYEPNKREVHRDGVDFVMRTFVSEFCHPPEMKAVASPPARDEEDVWCDEQKLEAFS